MPPACTCGACSREGYLRDDILTEVLLSTVFVREEFELGCQEVAAEVSAQTHAQTRTSAPAEELDDDFVVSDVPADGVDDFIVWEEACHLQFEEIPRGYPEGADALPSAFFLSVFEPEEVADLVTRELMARLRSLM